MRRCETPLPAFAARRRESALWRHFQQVGPVERAPLAGHRPAAPGELIDAQFGRPLAAGGRIRRAVDIILGNSGWDCINDHSLSNPNNPDDNFEDVMQLVDTFAEQFEET